MPRKSKRYHYIYKTTCNVTNKFYVGMHSTNNLEDGYLGSGKRLWYSRKKYGDENHTKEILEFLDDRRSLKEREAKIVNEQFLEDEMCMNLTLGGNGGIYNKDHMEKFSKAGIKAFKEKMKDEDYSKSFKSKMASIQRKAWENLEYRNRMIPILKNQAKPHTQESKDKIGLSNSIKQKGNLNSQYGKVWIYHLNKKKSIKVPNEELTNYLTMGWIKGRKLKF